MSDSTKIPTLDVLGHKVPVSAYKRIVELWRSGWTESEIAEDAMNTMRNKNIVAITDVVLGAINDQKFACTFFKDYIKLPVDSPFLIRHTQLALQEIRAELARAEAIEEKLAVEAMRLIESRPKQIVDAKAHSERVGRQAHIDQKIKEALEKRQKAEEDASHVKEVEKIRRRLAALSQY